MSVQQQPPKHRRSESLPHPEGSTRGMQQRRQSLQPSFTQPCQTTSDCLLKNFLPFWTDPPLDHGHAHIQAKDEESQSSSTYLKRGETTQTGTDLTTHTLHH